MQIFPRRTWKKIQKKPNKVCQNWKMLQNATNYFVSVHIPLNLMRIEGRKGKHCKKKIENGGNFGESIPPCVHLLRIFIPCLKKCCGKNWAAQKSKVIEFWIEKTKEQNQKNRLKWGLETEIGILLKRHSMHEAKARHQRCENVVGAKEGETWHQRCLVMCLVWVAKWALFADSKPSAIQFVQRFLVLAAWKRHTQKQHKRALAFKEPFSNCPRGRNWWNSRWNWQHQGMQALIVPLSPDKLKGREAKECH